MKHRILCLILCLLLFAGLFPSAAMASTDWPDNVSIEADAGIIMDAHSGAVLYGKNIHDTYPPASITKVLTALIVLQHCSLDEEVTFSYDAVHQVDTNSSSAGYDVGDQATVKDLLYALLLKSANEAANALAEHVSGSMENFAKLMNETAASLGCVDSHFANPSGLQNDNHYVSAYDMALITRKAFENKEFCKIVATTYYELAPNKLNPEGQGISPGNKMVKKNWPDQYCSDVIGGKTGYTSMALNTLVECAQQDDTRFVTVILHSSGTQYTDTQKLLNFGFKNFRSVKISDYDKTFASLGSELQIGGLPTSQQKVLTIDPDSSVILPKTADFTETKSAIDYKLPPGAPANAVAGINYALGDKTVGRAYLTLTNPLADEEASIPEALLTVSSAASAGAGQESGALSSQADSVNPFGETGSSGAETAAEPGKPSAGRFKISLKVPTVFWFILIAAAVAAGLAGGGYYYVVQRIKREESERQRRRQRRSDRLRESGVSESEFNLMIQKHRSDKHLKPDPHSDKQMERKPRNSRPPGHRTERK